MGRVSEGFAGWTRLSSSKKRGRQVEGSSMVPSASGCERVVSCGCMRRTGLAVEGTSQRSLAWS